MDGDRIWKVVDACDPRDPHGKNDVPSLIEVLTRLTDQGWVVFQVVATPWMYKVIAYSQAT